MGAGALLDGGFCSTRRPLLLCAMLIVGATDVSANAPPTGRCRGVSSFAAADSRDETPLPLPPPPLPPNVSERDARARFLIFAPSIACSAFDIVFVRTSFGAENDDDEEEEEEEEGDP